MNPYQAQIKVYKKVNRLLQDPTEIYLNSSTKYRQNLPKPLGHDYETLKGFKKSIDYYTKGITIGQSHQRSNTTYKRIPYHFKKNQKRYDENEGQQVRESKNRSPYLKKQFDCRATSLNRSNQRIKSNSFTKPISPRQIYKQPKSSMSYHYDVSTRKRRVSVLNEHNESQPNLTLEEAKGFYHKHDFRKSIDALNKYLKSNRRSLQGQYYLGMSLINNNEIATGVKHLEEVLASDPHFKKTLFLVVALAYKKLHKYQEGISVLNRGVEIFPDYYENIFYRGKLYLKLQDYQRAKQDFVNAIALNPQKGLAYVGKAVCQKEMNLMTAALETIEIGLKNSLDMKNVLYEKRAQLYYNSNQLELALRDIDSVSKLNGGSYSANLALMKGTINYKLCRCIDAMLAFEETLKCNASRDINTNAIQMMIRMKVQDKDLYEAYHILNRTANFDVQANVVNVWRLFLEACLFLMKKKYKEGINTFNQLLSLPTFQAGKNISQSQKERYAFLRPLVHLYKAFGDICDGKSQAAEQEYEQHTKLCQQLSIPDNNLSKDYNQLILQAYKLFPASLHFIQKARDLIPNKPEPHLYLAFDIISNKLLGQMVDQDKQKSEKKQKQQQKIKIAVQQAIVVLTQGISHLPQLSNNHISSFYYFRSILHMRIKELNAAICDIDKAIQKSQDNIPKYFSLRGLIFACLGNFSQAIQDLSVAINLDEKYSKPYLERSKCLQIQGNSNQAFLDLQKYITLAPEDPCNHKYAGFLLFQNCAYDDCLSAFNHGSDLHEAEMFLTKAKANFLLGRFSDALQLFEEYKLLTGCKDYESDMKIIKICLGIQQKGLQKKRDEYFKQLQQIMIEKSDQNSKIFKYRDLYQIKASINLLLGEYEEAESNFKSTLVYFQKQKRRELENNYIEDNQEFEDEWSEIEIKFNIALLYLCRQQYQAALRLLQEFQNSSQKGKNWDFFIAIIQDLESGNDPDVSELDVFEQRHRISAFWPKLPIPGSKLSVSLVFSYPFVEPPELMPEFDDDLLKEFHISKVENKPEAPWINRSQKGLVFTPNIQAYDNLQLSFTSRKGDQSEHQKPTSEMQNSMHLSRSEVQINTEDLKKKFKLNSKIEMKLKRIMEKAA